MLESPAKTKLCWPDVLELVPPTLLLPKLEGRNSIQGTAANLPPLDVSVEEVEVGDGVVAVELLELDLVLPEVVLRGRGRNDDPERGGRQRAGQRMCESHVGTPWRYAWPTP